MSTCKYYKMGALKNIAKFTGKHLCQSLIFNKVAYYEKYLGMAASDTYSSPDSRNGC